jgi:hypothetical protein
LEKQSVILVYSSLRGLIISNFSIFEHYLNLLWGYIWVYKWESWKEGVTSFLVRIFKKLWYDDISRVIEVEFFKYYKEYYLRRNLYVHEYWIITEKYLKNIKKNQLEKVLPDLWKFGKIYKVWNFLVFNKTYLLESFVVLNTIWIILWVLYKKRGCTKKKFIKILEEISDMLLGNENWEYVYLSVYVQLCDVLNLEKYIDFTLWYIISLKKLMNVNNENIDKKNISKKLNKIYEYRINNMNVDKFNIKQLCIFYWITKQFDKLSDTLINNLEKDRNWDVIAWFFKYDFLCKYLLRNRDIVNSKLKALNININFVLDEFTMKNIKYIKQFRKILQ